MNLGLGCKQPLIEPHKHRASFRQHPDFFKVAASVGPNVDLRKTDLIAATKDQGRTGSCEAHSGSGATESAFALAGDPLGFIPSEIDWYRGLRGIERARNVARGHTLPALVDEGGLTEDAIAFMSIFGLRPRKVAQTSDGRNSDCEETTVNDEPSFGELEEDAVRLFVGPYAINPQASDAEDLVRASLTARIPVRVDSFVDTAFMNWTSNKAPVGPANTNDPNGGGHAMYIVGYGTGVYILRNSWGLGFGDHGDWFVTSSWLRDSWGLYPWSVRRAA